MSIMQDKNKDHTRIYTRGDEGEKILAGPVPIEREWKIAYSEGARHLKPTGNLIITSYNEMGSYLIGMRRIQSEKMMTKGKWRSYREGLK
jgi:hypothetical protein